MCSNFTELMNLYFTNKKYTGLMPRLLINSALRGINRCKLQTSQVPKVVMPMTNGNTLGLLLLWLCCPRLIMFPSCHVDRAHW